MKKKPVRRGMSGVKMVFIGVRLTVSESQHIVERALEAHEGNISSYIRWLVHKDKQGKE